MKKIAITLGIMCFILTASIFIQVKTLKEVTNEEEMTLAANSELKDEVFKWRQNYKDAYKQLEEIEARLEQVRTQAATVNSTDVIAENQIKQNKKLLGMTEVKGSGVIIRLDEKRDNNEDTMPEVVHDIYLLDIVNELFNAGADAISINGKRIISTTSILCDGNIIRVNDEIVGVPIEIKAICYPQAIYNLKRPGGYLSYIAYGLKVECEESDDITIPKYEGVYSYDYITK